jgi:hypothetical protein
VRIRWRAMGQGLDPREQQAHLLGPYCATVGPEGDAAHGEWARAVFDTERSREPVAEGFAFDQVDAKRAVVEWARPRAPRTLRRRLRSLKRRLT